MLESDFEDELRAIRSGDPNVIRRKELNKIKELEWGKKMEEEQANGLYWEEIRQTVAGLSAFPKHYRAEVPGGWLVLSVLNLSVGAGTGITFFPDPHHEWNVKADEDQGRGAGQEMEIEGRVEEKEEI